MKRKFLNIGLIATLAFGMTFTMYSCSGGGDDAGDSTEQTDGEDEKEKEPVSEKGNWTEADRERANSEVAKVKADLEVVLGDDAEAYIDCYLEKVEANFDSFAAADSDQAGCEELAKDCMTELMDIEF